MLIGIPAQIMIYLIDKYQTVIKNLISMGGRKDERWAKIYS